MIEKGSVEHAGVPSLCWGGSSADDIATLVVSIRISERLMESAVKYLEGKLKLKVNRDKSEMAAVNMAFTKERLMRNGFYDLAVTY